MSELTTQEVARAYVKRCQCDYCIDKLLEAALKEQRERDAEITEECRPDGSAEDIAAAIRGQDG